MTSNPNAAVKANAISRAEQVLGAVADLRSEDFTGVGVVFYECLVQLPHLQLSNGFVKADPGRFVDVDLASALSSLSVARNPLHDGFHFVDARSWHLTHLSQFISPPIPHNAEQKLHGAGARLMAALLASLQPGIVCAGLVSQGGEVHLFSRGNYATQKN
ncbi:hypothetical protein [Comamonas jiangduensis]|uniref:hypothetical protein n=1 Tax=Comamonas jiangduensis TaxID=1194168 RepID=UPI0028B042BB|nr:hypothetical protein [Comamonas jiangduensis]